MHSQSCPHSPSSSMKRLLEPCMAVALVEEADVVVVVAGALTPTGVVC